MPDQFVLCARSPHITMGNLYVAVNAPYQEIDDYFNLTPNIVCVNAIRNNLQQRLNGCDYDSDSMESYGDRRNYELMIDGSIGVEASVDTICTYLKSMA